MAEATYAHKNPSATQVAQPPVWSGHTDMHRRQVARGHGDTATRSGPKLRPSQVPGHLATVGFQPKLKVSQPGDVYEQEADEIADRVMRGPAGGASGSPG